jgi:nitroimidazol reductase NimA-like FMN-containing flavoprotein (pyridoxamine 5'-phosphate oxidase superfamily)
MAEDETVVWVDDIDTDVCWKLLANHVGGRVGFAAVDGPMVLPVNHRVDEQTIVFRTGPTILLEALKDGAQAAFEVDELDAHAETGWSVLVRGRAYEIDLSAAQAVAARVALHPWAPGERDHWIRIVPEAVTGRAISRQRSTTHETLLPYMPAG